MRKETVALLCAIGAALGSPCRARGDGLEQPARWTAGIDVDLLPIVLSAAAGEVGASLQGWVGRGAWRLRAVGARIAFPDGLTEAPFRGRETTALALVCDRFFRDGFRGPWVGAGAEAWRNGIGSEAGPDRAEWTEWVATAGAGWVFPVWRGLVLNPWGAAHVRLNDPDVVLYGERYAPPRVQAEVSLKVGWIF